MPEHVTIAINGKKLNVPEGTAVTAALAMAGVERFRRSVKGESRTALCGMGVCFECRVTINGEPHRRSCITICEEGMEVRTDD